LRWYPSSPTGKIYPPQRGDQVYESLLLLPKSSSQLPHLFRPLYTPGDPLHRHHHRHRYLRSPYNIQHPSRTLVSKIENRNAPTSAVQAHRPFAGAVPFEEIRIPTGIVAAVRLVALRCVIPYLCADTRKRRGDATNSLHISMV
jgi:hypothetical protein